MLLAHPSQAGQQLIGLDVQDAGDHARGLFEVAPSVAASAAHSLEDVAVAVAQRHHPSLCLRPSGHWRATQPAEAASVSGGVPPNPTRCTVMASTATVTDPVAAR